jgi:thioredoxin-related protein
MQNTIIGVLGGIVLSLVVFIVYSQITNNNNKNETKLDLPTYSTTYNPQSNPYLDMQKAGTQAQKTNKKILMIVGDNGCPWSSEFDRFMQSNQELNKKLYSNYEVLKVYYNSKSTNPKIQSFLKQFPAGAGTPHFYVLDSKKRPLTSKKSVDLEQGFSYSPLKVENFLDKWIKHK